MIQQQTMNFEPPVERQHELLPEQQTKPGKRWYKPEPGKQVAPAVPLNPRDFIKAAKIIPVN